MKQITKTNGVFMKKIGELLLTGAKKKLIFSACYSLIFAFALYIGKPIYMAYSLPSKELGNYLFPFKYILGIYLFTLIISYVFFTLFEFLSDNNSKSKGKKSWTIFLLFWLGTVITCTISWLAFYPGINTYDFGIQARDAYAGFANYNLHHPWLHTLLIEISIKIAESLDILAVSVYGMGQVAALCSISTFMMWYICKRTNSKFVIILSALYLLFNPVILIFSIIPIKDVCFALILALTVIEIDKMNYNIDGYLSKKINWFIYVGLVILCCMFRNNAIYAFAMLAPIQLFVYKHYRYKIAVLSLLPIVLSFFINSYICPEVIGMERGEAREALCVPMIQITSLAYNDEELSAEDVEFIAKYFDFEKIKEVYNPRNADGVKDCFSDETYISNKGDFWKGWLRMLGEYPKQYFEAFLSLNSSYWYALSDGLDKVAGIEYIEVSLDPSERNNTKAPHALKVFERFADYSLVEKVGGLFNFFKISVPIWILLFICSADIYLRNYKSLLCMAPLLLIYITFLAGPLSNIRYIFYFYYLFPLIFVISYSKINKKE